MRMYADILPRPVGRAAARRRLHSRALPRRRAVGPECGAACRAATEAALRLDADHLAETDAPRRARGRRARARAAGRAGRREGVQTIQGARLQDQRAQRRPQHDRPLDQLRHTDHAAHRPAGPALGQAGHRTPMPA